MHPRMRRPVTPELTDFRPDRQCRIIMIYAPLCAVIASPMKPCKRPWPIQEETIATLCLRTQDNRRRRASFPSRKPLRHHLELQAEVSTGRNSGSEQVQLIASRKALGDHIVVWQC